MLTSIPTELHLALTKYVQLNLFQFKGQNTKKHLSSKKGLAKDNEMSLYTVSYHGVFKLRTTLIYCSTA